MKSLLVIIALFMLSAAPAFADVAVSVTDPGASPTDAASPASTIYLNLTNNGADPVTLTSMSSPSGTVSLYQSNLENAPYLGPVTVAPGQTVSFRQEQNFIKLDNLQSPLVPDSAVQLTLTFDAGSTTVNVPVTAGTCCMGGVAVPPKPKTKSGVNQ